VQFFWEYLAHLLCFAFSFASFASKDSSSLSLSLLLCYVTRNPAGFVVFLSFVRESGVSVVIFFALVYLRLEDLDCLAATFSPEAKQLKGNQSWQDEHSRDI
jgi:hypothetical protein